MSSETTVDEKARRWWRDLNPKEDSGNPGNRAALATLRRATEPREIWMVEAYHNLRRRLGGGRDDCDQIAILAHVLAHVRDEPQPPQRFAVMLGARPEGSTDASDHVMSPLRFKRLIEAVTPLDRMREYRRAVRLIGNRANVGDLALSILAWNDQTRRRWSFDYFGASLADPEATAAATQSGIADQQPTPEATP
jgi:CRISPR system Cascade subunit CasB